MGEADIEPRPELSTRRQGLDFLIGYYALMLDNPRLAPDWRSAYEERRQELVEELNSLNGGNDGS